MSAACKSDLGDIKPVKVEYGCQFCSKNYADKWHLDLHLEKKHGIPRECKCVICQKEFSNSESLSRHMDIHKKVHKCPKCDYSANRINLVMHHLDTHDKKKIFPCYVCSREFKTRVGVRTHLKNVHSDDPTEEVVLEKDTANNKDDSILDFIRNMSADASNFETEIENFIAIEKPQQKADPRKVLSEMANLGNDMDSSESAKCDICEKVFSHSNYLEIHMMSHFEEEERSQYAFRCDKCPKRYRHDTSVARHKRQKHASEDENLEAERLELLKLLEG